MPNVHKTTPVSIRLPEELIELMDKAVEETVGIRNGWLVRAVKRQVFRDLHLPSTVHPSGRQCSDGWHNECSDRRGVTCMCPCHHGVGPATL